MIIRTLCTADAAAFKSIRIQATQTDQSIVYQTPEEESARPLEDLKLQLGDANTRVFGALEDEQLVGICAIARDPETKRRHTARIRMLYVIPAHRQRGIAKQLLNSALDYAAGTLHIRQIKLTVSANNSSALRLYTAVGFKTYATEPKVLCIDGQFFDENMMLLSLR
jgi:RimJ/RimL family protein N-acetyltransferase